MRHILYCLLWSFLVLGNCGSVVREVKVYSQTLGTNEPKGIVFRAPDGFEERPQNHMFYHAGLRASISPAYQPGAVFDKVTAEFTEKNLRNNGMALREKQMKDVKGRKTFLVKGDRIKSKYPQIFVTVVFPADGGCVQLTAIYPADLQPELQQKIDSAILNAHYNK